MMNLTGTSTLNMAESEHRRETAFTKTENLKADNKIFEGKLKSSKRKQAERVQACVGEVYMFSSGFISAGLTEIALILIKYNVNSHRNTFMIE